MALDDRVRVVGVQRFPGMNDLILVYITHPSEEVALHIAQTLLEKRLIACANFHPIKSLYRWQGQVMNEQEVVAVCKTTEDKYRAVCEEVERMHPYTVPCIIKIPVTANDSYTAWICNELA